MASPSKASTPRSQRTINKLNGLYKDGVWCCNCPSRPQAVRFQTKKENQNKGRWFYTCQKKPGCGFFLWDDEAEVRAKAVILANNTSEPDPQFQTPRKPTQTQTGLLTPQTERRPLTTTPRTQFKTPPTSARERMIMEDTEFDDSDTEELANSFLTERDSFISQPNWHADPPSSPSKVPRTPKTSSPGKRRLGEYAYVDSHEGNATSQSPISSLQSRIPPASAELCPSPTPKDLDAINSDSRPIASNLANDVVGILERLTVLPNNARNEVIERLNREDSQHKGAIRARDILRGQNQKKTEEIEKKDKEILKLKQMNTNLKAQLETLNRSFLGS